MRFSIETRLLYRFQEPCEVLLLVEPASTDTQTVIHERLTAPAGCRLARFEDPLSGERRAVFDAAGDVEIGYAAEVELAAVDHDFSGRPAGRVRDLPASVLEHLRPSRYCPSDRLERLVRREFGHLEGGEKAGAIMDFVGRNLTYEAGVSTCASGALDTLADGAGVCRDYAHLAIALCRAADIPARAVSAYAWRLDPPDMHAVVEVYLDGRWWLADPTRLAPVEGLVRVATGRDAADIAFMHIFGKAELLEQSFRVDRRERLAAVA
ncbi:transglutaminase family protein [uncultured Phenylobacterium sp.]|uniref:transglutaminase-like domain-containing protein n=1 Tax=uncultured Phenylobacterium sp. TaxID=349273 RepID=UPI0025E08974|nr:transglutaminase family protein [uncultured Phenylobacterium sp.]